MYYAKIAQKMIRKIKCKNNFQRAIRLFCGYNLNISKDETLLKRKFKGPDYTIGDLLLTGSSSAIRWKIPSAFYLYSVLIPRKA